MARILDRLLDGGELRTAISLVRCDPLAHLIVERLRRRDECEPRAPLPRLLQRKPAFAAAAPAADDDYSHKLLLFERNSQMKNGPPKPEVSTPIGSSAGTTMVRATRSASSIRHAPTQAAAGSRRRWSGPTSERARCGAIRPTKPITPDSATAAPVPNAASASGGETKWVVPEKFFDQFPQVLATVSPLPGEEALYAQFRWLMDVAGRLLD